MKHTWIVIMCFFLTACSEKKSEEKTLRLTFLSEPNSLDPRFGYEIPANHTIKMLFEGLMRHKPDGELSCAACDHYSISPDQRQYTFHLRKAKWSNGEEVTAHDFEYAWKSVVNPELPTQGAADFYPIKNVQAIVQKKLPIDSMGVMAFDKETLIVDLEFPAPYFLELTATSAFSPVYLGDKEPLSELCLVTNGPFKIKERKPHDHLFLEKNPSYWNRDEVNFDRIEISIVEDANSQLALFEKKEVDWFGKPFTKLPLDAVSSLRDQNVLHLFPEKAVYWYFLNTEKFPFNHKKFRRAFALAINRNELVSHVLKEDEKAATSVSFGNSYFEDGASEKARLIFDEALSELNLKKEDLPQIKLSYCGIETNQRIAMAVQQMWQKAFDIKIALDPQEWTLYYDALSRKDFQIGGLSWHSRISDPIYNLQLFQFKEDRLNMSAWENETFQKLIAAATEEIESTKRLALLKEAEGFLMEEMPVIPIYFLTVSYGKCPELEDVYVSEVNDIDFAYAYKKKV